MSRVVSAASAGSISSSGWVGIAADAVLAAVDRVWPIYSYANWIESIRGLMKWAGFQGTFGGNDTGDVMSDDDGEWHCFRLRVRWMTPRLLPLTASGLAI
jgi:hypothetical protein